MFVGYARVSTTDQSLDIQLDQLAQAGVEKVFSEQRSGKTAANRPELQRALDFCREGDTFVVTRLDRFARSAADLHRTVEQLTAKGVGFRCLQQGGIDTTTTHGKLMLGILAAVAEFELDIRQERQREGIQSAKVKGVYRGRKPSIDRKAVQQMSASGLSARTIAKSLGCSPASVYRVQQRVPSMDNSCGSQRETTLRETC